MIAFYGIGVFGISITVLSAVVSALIATGLVLARAFLKTSMALRPGPLYFSVIAYVFATVSFVYSSNYGEAWGPLLLGTFFTLVAVAGTLVSMKFRKPSTRGKS
jgi:hypothetical protein